jgi:hypothetical protein
MQNPNGGFASYELVRGSSKLEWLNTAEVFGKFTRELVALHALINSFGVMGWIGDIMIEYTYPE